MNSADPWSSMQSAPPVVGRHGGGGGGHGWGGRGGRRYFGGWGGWGGGYGPWWDYPPYPYPYDLEIEDLGVAPSAQVSGRGIYNDRGIYRVPGLLAEIAPLVSAGSGGMSVSLELDKNHRLHASICVDGRCYRGSIDVAPLIQVAMTKVRELHRDLHAAEAAHAAVGCAEEALDEAGVVLMGAMLDHHQSVMCGNFFDDIGNAVTGVVNTIGNALKPIEPIVATAASIGATAIGGPAAGAIAGKLVTASLANAGPKKDQAKATVAQAKAQAATDPKMAATVDVAHKTAAQTMVAYHVLNTLHRAQAGDKSAQAQIHAVHQSASQGDPAAQWTQGVLKQVTGIAQNQGKPVADMSTSQWTPQDKAAIEMDDPSASAGDDSSIFGLADDATAAITSGALPLVLFVAASLGGYAWWRGHARRAAEAAMVTAAQADAAKDARQKLELAKKAIDLTEQAKASSPPALPGEKPPEALPGGDQISVGASAPMLAVIRKQAHDLAAGKDDPVVAVMLATGGKWFSQGFATSDDADDWFGGETKDPSGFVYAAYFDKSDATWPGPLNEAIGKVKT